VRCWRTRGIKDIFSIILLGSVLFSTTGRKDLIKIDALIDFLFGVQYVRIYTCEAKDHEGRGQQVECEYPIPNGCTAS
jgi:hypothetical protein